MKPIVLSAIALALLAGSVGAETDSAIHKLAEDYVASGYQQGDAQHTERLQQDETQKICTQYRNEIPSDQKNAFMEKEKATIQYPENDKFMGDWEKGKEIFNTGFGMRVGVISPDKADKPRGGNCYACHTGDPKELAAGNIGASLTGYGKLRGNTPETAKYTYEKIYNSNAYMACSNMPRFGHNGILKPEQIADLVAFLVDPKSPVNK